MLQTEDLEYFRCIMVKGEVICLVVQCIRLPIRWDITQIMFILMWNVQQPGGRLKSSELPLYRYVHTTVILVAIPFYFGIRYGSKLQTFETIFKPLLVLLVVHMQFPCF